MELETLVVYLAIELYRPLSFRLKKSHSFLVANQTQYLNQTKLRVRVLMSIKVIKLVMNKGTQINHISLSLRG